MLFLVCFTLAVLTDGGGPVAVACCVIGSGLLVLTQFEPAARRWAPVPVAVLTYVPIAFGVAAVNLDFLLVATVLRCAPRMIRWPIVAAVVTGSGFAHADWRTDPADFGYAVFTTATIGIVTYTLILLPELTARLTATRDELTRTTLARERLRVADTLHEALGANLTGVMFLLRTARQELVRRPERAEHTVRRAAAVTRQMIRTVRETSAVHRETADADGSGHSDTTLRDPEPVARLAPRLALFGLASGLSTLVLTQTLQSPHHRVAVLIGGVLISGLLFAQLLRPHLGNRILVAQTAIVLLPLPWLGAVWSGWVTLLAIPVLLTQRGTRAAVAIIALIALRALCAEPAARQGIQTGWVLPAMEAVLTLLGMAYFWQLSVQINRSRAELIRLTVQLERLRVARDIHDLLGLTLSVLVLKSDLIADLVTCAPERAAAEIDESLRIAAEAQRESLVMVSDHAQQPLRDELTSAAAVLTDAGITVELDCADRLPETAAAVLAPVAREAITNILRHSTATRVEIACEQRDAELRLRIRNDGVPADPNTGQGLRNMRARVRDAGGEFDAAAHGCEFLLSATVPVGGAAGHAGYAKCTVVTPEPHA